MNLIRLLLRASWSTVVIAVLMGGLSGGCAVGLIALIATALRQSQPPSLLALGGFIGLCCIQLITRFISEVSLTSLGQGMTCHLQMLLGQRILASSLRQIENLSIKSRLKMADSQPQSYRKDSVNGWHS